ATAATLGGVSGLKLNEWLANSPDGDDWFEIYNSGTSPADLTGIYLTHDPSIAGQTQFRVGPLSFVGARGFAVFQADGNPGNGRHHVNFNMDADGDALRIYSSTLALIDTVYFGPQNGGVPEGRLPDGQGTIVSFPVSASRGIPNYRPLTTVVLNEVLNHADSPLQQAVELANLNSQSANIGGWYLSDSAANLKKYRVPNGTVVTGNQFYVVTAADLNGGNGSIVPFTLDSIRGGT